MMANIRPFWVKEGRHSNPLQTKRARYLYPTGRLAKVKYFNVLLNVEVASSYQLQSLTEKMRASVGEWNSLFWRVDVAAFLKHQLEVMENEVKLNVIFSCGKFGNNVKLSVWCSNVHSAIL